MPHKIFKASTLGMFMGNLFEHYDSALFSLLSPFLASLFFPQQDPLTALILTFCIIPIGMVARPVGSLVFGYIGDLHGRKEALFIALSGMAVVTVCMGFIPTYEQAGLTASFLLALCRVLQNFFMAGETVGGAIYLIENTPEDRQDIISAFYNASTIAGILLASLGLTLLNAYQLTQEYWWILYLLGSATAICAGFLRTGASISSIFNRKTSPPFLVKAAANSFSKENLSKRSFIHHSLFICWQRRHAVIAIAVASGFSYSCYTVALVMMNGLIPIVSSITHHEMLHINTSLLVIDFFLLPLFGILAQRYSREKMMAAAGILTALIGIPLFSFLESSSLLMIISLRIAFVVIGVWFSAPFYSWAQTLVPSSERYTVISFAYAIGTQILGSPTAAISLWLFHQTGWIASAALYWICLGLLASYYIAITQTAHSEEMNKQT